LRAEQPRPFEPSLFVHATVVNNVHDSHAIIDAGLKSFATDGPSPEFSAGAPMGASYRFFGDEHGAVVYGQANVRLDVGATVACLVPHCDPTVNLYDAYHCVRGDTLVDIRPVDARGNP
jgi:3-hydroxy-D-aspartate aldolase